jgi:divalent metal cation (Fe/Co/Zn/Cd) transporter
MHSRADKIFAITITAALLGALVGAIYLALRFWTGMAADFDPAATWPLIWGVLFSLVLGAIVVGVFLYGRRKEIRGEQ